MASCLGNFSLWQCVLYVCQSSYALSGMHEGYVGCVSLRLYLLFSAEDLYH